MFFAAQYQNGNKFSSLAKSVNSFGYSLYKTVNTKIDGNFVISPLNTATILSIIYLGSKGNTTEEMFKTLKLTLTEHELMEIFASYLTRLTNANSNNEIEFTHLVFVNDQIDINSGYQNMLMNYFSANVLHNNFINETKWINKIIHKNTNSKIKTLVNQGVVNNRSTVLLTDALYFAGSWITPFSKEKTISTKFYLKRNKIRNVMIMHLTSNFDKYTSQNPKCDILELPFENYFSLYIILPEKGVDIIEFEEKLNNSIFETIVNHKGFTNRLVTVGLPTLFMSTRIEMKPYLMSLGIINLFDPIRNDFSRIFKGPMNAYINKIVQRTVIKFKEDGNRESINIHNFDCQNSFTVDHPFIFLVVDKIAKMIVLMGKITNPYVKYYYGPI